MKINERILDVLKEFRIPKEDGLCYLLALYYDYKPSYIPDELKRKMNITQIVTSDNGIIKWNIQLFEGQEIAFDWVKTEYCQLFKDKNELRGGNSREAISRLKNLFSKHPDIRKEEILGATKMYLQNTDANYIMFPHYFIEKGIGATKTETILNWVDLYREAKSQEEGRKSITNTIR